MQFSHLNSSFQVGREIHILSSEGHFLNFDKIILFKGTGSGELFEFREIFYVSAYITVFGRKPRKSQSGRFLDFREIFPVHDASDASRKSKKL